MGHVKLKKRLVRGAQAAAHRGGFELVRRHFYSPLPDVESLPERLWDGPLDTVGVELFLNRALDYLRSDLAPYLDEYRPPEIGGSSTGFFVRNGSYQAVDAEILYAILRHERPAKVVELGSGASSYVMQDARSRSGSDAFEHVIYDPYPLTAKSLGPLHNVTINAEGVENGDPEEIASQLGVGDLLFVDTTHTVKTGGDVTWIVLSLLPRLSHGVIVHFHDIFLPYEYPRKWVVDERRAWAEQYLLQAFLAFNTDFEVLFPTYAVTAAAPDAIEALVPSFRRTDRPGSFWIRRTGGAARSAPR